MSSFLLSIDSTVGVDHIKPVADSWKGSTALETIVFQTSFTRIHKIILEILLLAGADTDTEDMLELAMEKNNAGVVDLLLSWETTSGRDSGLGLDSSALFSNN